MQDKSRMVGRLDASPALTRQRRGNAVAEEQPDFSAVQHGRAA